MVTSAGPPVAKTRIAERQRDQLFGLGVQNARGRCGVAQFPACRQEMPTLAEAQRRDGTVGFLFVNQGESATAIRAYLAGLGLPLREVLLDPGSQLGPAVGSRGLPTTLFYDAKGSLVDAHFGVLNPAASRNTPAGLAIDPLTPDPIFINRHRHAA